MLSGTLGRKETAQGSRMPAPPCPRAHLAEASLGKRGMGFKQGRGPEGRKRGGSGTGTCVIRDGPGRDETGFSVNGTLSAHLLPQPLLVPRLPCPSQP